MRDIGEEIGFARWRGLDEPIESRSMLIRPDHDWTYWSEDAEARCSTTIDGEAVAAPAEGGSADVRDWP